MKNPALIRKQIASVEEMHKHFNIEPPKKVTLTDVKKRAENDLEIDESLDNKKNKDDILDDLDDTKTPETIFKQRKDTRRKKNSLFDSNVNKKKPKTRDLFSRLKGTL